MCIISFSVFSCTARLASGWERPRPGGKGREKTLIGGATNLNKTRGVIERLWRIGLRPERLVYISTVMI